jgi:hypothetical protein
MKTIQFFSKINGYIFLCKKVAKNWTISVVFNKLTKVNNHPFGKSFPQSGHPAQGFGVQCASYSIFSTCQWGNSTF